MAASRVLPQNVRSFPAHYADPLLPIVTDSSRSGPARSLATSAVQLVSDSALQSVLRSYFDSLLAAHGPQNWWPGRTRFEIIVGAILTQNTSWANVERAIANLRSAQMLTPSAISAARPSRLAILVRPSGYFRQKAKKLKAFARFLQKEYGGSLERMFETPTEALRE